MQSWEEIPRVPAEIFIFVTLKLGPKILANSCLAKQIFFAVLKITSHVEQVSGSFCL